MPRRAVDSSFFESDEVSRCKICGCDDLRACPGGCSWATVDREKNVGVCSNCVGKKPFKKGTVFTVAHKDESACRAKLGLGVAAIKLAAETWTIYSHAANFAAAANKKRQCAKAEHVVKVFPPVKATKR